MRRRHRDRICDHRIGVAAPSSWLGGTWHLQASGRWRAAPGFRRRISPSASASRCRRTGLERLLLAFMRRPAGQPDDLESRAQTAVGIGESLARRSPAIRCKVARLSGVRRRSVRTLVAPMRRRSRISASGLIVAHRQPVDYRSPAAQSRRAAAARRDRGYRQTARRAATRRPRPRFRPAAKASRNSVRLSPPIIAASNRPSGLSARRIWISVPGRSLTNCSAKADTTRSSEPSAKGSASSSAATRGAKFPPCPPSSPRR